MACSHLTNRQQSEWGSLTLVALVRRLVEVPRYIAMSAIGTQQTCSMRSRMSVFGGKADVDQPLLANLIYEFGPLRDLRRSTDKARDELIAVDSIARSAGIWARDREFTSSWLAEIKLHQWAAALEFFCIPT